MLIVLGIIIALFALLIVFCIFGMMRVASRADSQMFEINSNNNTMNKKEE